MDSNQQQAERERVTHLEAWLPVGTEFTYLGVPMAVASHEDGVLYDRTPRPYTAKSTAFPGLSPGDPDDGAWRPLPSALAGVTK